MQVKDPRSVLCLTTSNFGKLWVLEFRISVRERTPCHSSRSSRIEHTKFVEYKTSRIHVYWHVLSERRTCLHQQLYMIHDTCHACLTWESFFEFLCRFYIHTIECISSNLTFTLGLIPKDRCDWVSAPFKKRKFGFFILGSNFKITH